MAVNKEGSVMEGIFAMYCAAHLIDPGKANDTAIEGFINDLRIDTELGDLATKGKKSIDYHRTFPGHLGTAKKHFGNGNNKLSVVTGKQARELVKKDPKYSTLQKALPVAEKFFDTVGVKGYIDFSQVELKVRVKEAETGEHYGKNLEKLLAEESKDEKVVKQYENIKKRMKQLIKSKNAQFFRKLDGAKFRYLSNAESDVVHWTVDADGIGGESSGGDIKQDVTIRVFADGKRILEDELNFSLKASSVTVHGGGVYNTMPEIYDMFKSVITGSDIADGKKYMDDIKGKAQGISTKASIDALWKLIGNHLPTPQSAANTQWSDHFWGILEKRIFGSSTAYDGTIQLVEMNQKEVREISTENFDKLKNSGVKLCPVYERSKPGSESPGTIYIMPVYPKGNKKESTLSNCVYKMRISYLQTKEKGVKTGKYMPTKIFIELGGKNSIVHDENFEKFIKKKLI